MSMPDEASAPHGVSPEIARLPTQEAIAAELLKSDTALLYGQDGVYGGDRTVLLAIESTGIVGVDREWAHTRWALRGVKNAAASDGVDYEMIKLDPYASVGMRTLDGDAEHVTGERIIFGWGGTGTVERTISGQQSRSWMTQPGEIATVLSHVSVLSRDEQRKLAREIGARYKKRYHQSDLSIEPPMHAAWEIPALTELVEQALQEQQKAERAGGLFGRLRRLIGK